MVEMGYEEMTKRNITALAIVIFALASVMSYLSSRSLGAPTWSPQGKVEAIDEQGWVKGWVADPANPSAALTVRIFMDGQADSNFFEQLVANQERPDLAPLGYGTAHGFRFQVPAAFMEDGTQHVLYAFAVNPGTGEQASLLDAYGNQSFAFPFVNVNAGGWGSNDLGVNINAANDYLSYSGRRGMIDVYYGGTFLTPATISSRNTLRLHDGVYQPNLTGPAIFLKDNTAVIGDGWSTILKENSVPSNWIVITNDGAWPVPLAEPNYDISVKNLKIEGHPAQPFYSSQGPIQLGNVKRAIVSGIWFDSPHAFGVSVGGFSRRYYYGASAEKYWQMHNLPPGTPITNPDNGNTDMDLFAENVWIINNKFTHVASQDASTVNARLATISDNFFEKPGQAGGPGNTLIDIEPNSEHDLVQYTIIANNEAVTHEAFQNGHGNYIAFQPANAERGGPALIRYNKLNSATQITNWTSNGVIMKPESRDVLIYGNSFYGCGQMGFYALGTRIYIFDNLLDSCGGGGNPAVMYEQIYDSLFFSNTFQNNMPSSTQNNILEIAPSDRNIFAQNPGATYNLSGPNSHVQQNLPTVPFVYPQVTKPNINELSDGRIEITAPTTVPIRVLNNGVFSTVQLSVNADIHYTLDGSSPTFFSPRYYGPIKLAGTPIVTAKAFSGGLLESEVSVYTPTGTPYPNGVPFAVPGIIQAEEYNNGGEGVAYHDGERRNFGYVYRTNEGVDIAASDDPAGGGYYVGWAYAGEWLKYTINVPTTGTYTFDVRAKGVFAAGGTFHVEFNGVDKTGPIQVPNSDTWQTVTKTGLNLAAGTQVMRIVLDTPGSQVGVGNFNYFNLH